MSTMRPMNPVDNVEYGTPEPRPMSEWMITVVSMLVVVAVAFISTSFLWTAASALVVLGLEFLVVRPLFRQ